MLWNRKPEMVTPQTALPGRDQPAFEISGVHAVNGHQITPPFPEGVEVAVFALGCFWGAERLFWNVPGVWSTAVGYTAGFTPNPTYEETCTGLTGHTEAVLVAYDPAVVPYRRLLEVFFNEHDPTQENRQGNDVGTQYRSAVYADQAATLDAARAFIARLEAEGAFDARIVTEVAPLTSYWAAEDYHQDYYERHPGQGYCAFVIGPKMAKFRKRYAELLA